MLGFGVGGFALGPVLHAPAEVRRSNSSELIATDQRAGPRARSQARMFRPGGAVNPVSRVGGTTQRVSRPSTRMQPIRGR